MCRVHAGTNYQRNSLDYLNACQIRKTNHTNVEFSFQKNNLCIHYELVSFSMLLFIVKFNVNLTDSFLSTNFSYPDMIKMSITYGYIDDKKID